MALMHKARIDAGLFCSLRALFSDDLLLLIKAFRTLLFN
ncbi:hypothetical protein GA0071314_2337 [Halomonas sp. HL-93]|nr:hypothetical protein GA0071314_2337 [Halomonas sp. HL-93]